MNQVLLLVAVLLYVVIGVMSAVRSYGYAKRIGSPVVGDKLVVSILCLFIVALWPINVLCERIIIKRRFPHLLPQKQPKVKRVNLLERIAVAVEGLRNDGQNTVNRLLNDAEYLRQRIAGLEQSQRDLRYAKDAIAVERDEANRQAQESNRRAIAKDAEIARLLNEIARLTPPPAPAPAPAPAPQG